MPGLFDMPSPDEIRQQMAARLGQQSIARRSGPATAGAGIGKLLGALIAGKPPALEQAEQREKLLKHVASEQGVSFKDDPVGAMREGAELARKAGDMKLAMSFMDKSFTYAKATAKPTPTTKLGKLMTLEASFPEGSKQRGRVTAAINKEVTRNRSATEEISKVLDRANTRRLGKKLPKASSVKDLTSQERFRINQIQKIFGTQGLMKDIFAPPATEQPNDIIDLDK
jgi:hypothetical protein